MALFLLLLSSAAPASGTGAPASGTGAGAPWCRFPALSPSGEEVVFSCMGDLFLAFTSGGTARALTRGEALDTRPCWSPDGRWIAYASDRHGNFDVFVIPAEGGEARRLTWHSAADVPWCWTPDGESVLFSSARTDEARSRLFPARYLPELYDVDAGGGRPLMRLTTPALEVSLRADGAMLYQDAKGMEDEYRKRHSSSVTRDVWLLDAAGEHRRLTDFGGEDLEPCWSADGRRVYYLSEEGGTLNVWERGIEGDSRRLSRHAMHPVRSLSVSRNDLLCYTWDGGIWLLEPGGEPRRLDLRVPVDRLADHPRTLVLVGDADEVVLSPDGWEAAFVARGEVFVCSVEHGTTRRITDTPEQERSVGFSPDGRSLVYAGERGGSWKLFRSDLALEHEQHFYSSSSVREEVLLEGAEDYFQPRFSPDGREVAFLAGRTELRIIDLASGEQRVAAPGDAYYSYEDGDLKYDWSPDGKWLALHILDKGRWMDEIALVPAEGGTPVNITQSGYYDHSPRWSADGRALLFLSNRRGLRSHGSWGSQDDVHAVFTSREAWEWHRLSEEEFEELYPEDEEDEEEGEKERKKRDRRKRKRRKDDPAELPVVDVEWRGLEDRLDRLTLRSARVYDYRLTPEGDRLITLARFEDKADLWITELRPRETRRLAELGIDGGSLAMDPKGDFVLVLSSEGALSRVDLEDGKVDPVPYSAELTLRQGREWEYFFEHIWRQVREKFYVADLHGTAWDSLRAAYRRHLQGVDNLHDFADCLSEMLGELNASHTGAFARRRGEDRDATARLGVIHDPAWRGEGLLVEEVLPEGPFDRSDSRLEPGMLIAALDGRSVGEGENPWPLLNRRADRPLRVTVREARRGGGSWDEVIKPLGARGLRELLYKRWWRRNAADVDSLSDGRLGYVHVRGMNDRSFRHVYHEVLGRYADREGLVVDSRHNGGGWLTDDLIAFLSGRRTFRNVVRPGGRVIGEEPFARWNRPAIVLINESNYSDAHLFPYAFRDNGLGRLVGMPVAGTGTAVWWETLMDGVLVFGIPQVGMLDEEGRLLENQQLDPDVRVENDPASLAAGRDLQLERAVQELLKELE